MSAPDKKTAAYLTHELRAPLRALQFALELLRGELDKGASERNKRVLDASLWTAARLNSLVDEILDVSKIQSGRMEVAAVDCDPAVLTRDTVEFLLPWAERKGVRLSLRVKKGCPLVSGDPKRIVQVLTNLLSNALKFTPAGGEIEVRAAPGERDDAGFTVFSVRDTGCGISAEDLQRVFRYFAQAGTPEQKAEGTGLGLPLARSLVEIQGGRMWAESEPGKGSTFRFTIPAALSKKGARSPRRTAQRPEAGRD